jgi:DNA helicase-2/ATP-dependent DNA helicase PcrA
MQFIADFHIHSKHSRATSKNLDLEHLYLAAQQKGLTVVGTGDATHPTWMAELREKLSPAEDGLFRLRKDLESDGDLRVPPACRAPVRFVLTAEISNIYKKDGQTRKNHNLVFLPDMDTATRFNRELDRIGNIASDGRPILGLDARNLLEIVLGIHAQAFLVPAHIWTPWFSLLGSKSGFDGLEECFGDLAGHIFAVETGLSSDPAMNRRVSSLDHLTLISNSDAHSPSKLGREANRLDTELSFSGIRRALRRGRAPLFLGTDEFYPEEGKYHLDGHRKCGVRLTPEATRSLGGLCPKCGQPLTLGVLHRVEALADRGKAETGAHLPPFQCVIPLVDILAEVMQVGPGTRKVRQAWEMLLSTLGNERTILQECDPTTIERVGIPLLGEAIRRMRAGEIQLAAGYDGEYGRITIFDAEERRRLEGQRFLFGHPVTDLGKPGSLLAKALEVHPAEALAGTFVTPSPPGIARGILEPNASQRRAIEHPRGPLLIVAGPGTGKTSTLTRRMAWLIRDAGVDPKHLLGITFTEKAAAEMRHRLESLLGGSDLPLTATFHAFGLRLLQEDSRAARRIIDDEERRFVLQQILRRLRAEGLGASMDSDRLGRGIETAKQRLQDHRSVFAPVAADSAMALLARAYGDYQRLLTALGAMDFEDIIASVVLRLETDPAYAAHCRQRYSHVFVDEYQDLNHGQYRLIRALCPVGDALSVIGDPDQAIYGFRGADSAYFNRFIQDYPATTVVHLTHNYRSSAAILNASWQVIRKQPQAPTTPGAGERLVACRQGASHVEVLELPSAVSEAVAVGRQIESLVGGTGFFALDAGKVQGHGGSQECSFDDFAVLFRTSAQAEIVERVFRDAGIPYQHASRELFFQQEGVAEILGVYRLLHGRGGLRDLSYAAAVVPPTLTRAIVDVLCVWIADQGLDLPSALAQAARLPIPGLKQPQQRRVVEWAASLAAWHAGVEGLSVWAALVAIADLTGIALRMAASPGYQEAMETLALKAREADADADHFCRRLALNRDVDLYRPEAEKVSLMTIHAAKGLEFRVVFVVGCEDGWLPLRREAAGTEDASEERRLFYVAMTRAKERLYLTWARQRRLHGRPTPRTVSPYVLDIERQLRHHVDPSWNKRGPRSAQLKLF